MSPNKKLAVATIVDRLRDLDLDLESAQLLLVIASVGAAMRTRDWRQIESAIVSRVVTEHPCLLDRMMRALPSMEDGWRRAEWSRAAS